MKRFALAAVAVCLFTLAACGGHTATPADTHGLSNSHKGQLRSALVGEVPKGDLGLKRNATFGATSIILGQDNVDIYKVPTTVAAFGCYASGPYANCTSAASRFPHAHLVSISVQSYYHVGRILDAEPGDASASSAGGWVHDAIFNRHVWHPGVYSSAWQMSAVRSSLAAWHIPHCSSSTTKNCYVLWVADWDHLVTIPFGYDAKQYSGGFVADYDSFLPGFFTAPPPPNAPGCSTPSIRTSYCFGRFTTLKWFNRPSGSKTAKVKPWCYYGCVEQRLVRRLTGEIFASQTPAGLQGDLSRARAVCGRLIYLEQHRSVKENGDTYTYGRKRNVCGRSKNIARGSWAGYL